MTRDIPIIFSAPMVQAFLANRKTMTRRLAWRSARKGADAGGVNDRVATSWQSVKAGDRLWVRETLFKDAADERWRYSANKEAVTLPKDHPSVSAMIAWAHHKDGSSAPSIHMPRWASRLTLIVGATKTERLQDISETDADAEGIITIPRSLTRHGRMDGYGAAGTLPEDASTTRANAFRVLWCSLHGSESWDANPEVVALTLRVVKTNIDAVP